MIAKSKSQSDKKFFDMQAAEGITKHAGGFEATKKLLSSGKSGSSSMCHQRCFTAWDMDFSSAGREDNMIQMRIINRLESTLNIMAALQPFESLLKVNP